MNMNKMSAVFCSSCQITQRFASNRPQQRTALVWKTLSLQVSPPLSTTTRKQQTCSSFFSSTTRNVQQYSYFSSSTKDDIFISINRAEKIKSDDTTEKLLNPLGDDENRNKEENDNDNDDDDGMEQEEMFVMADVSFGHSKREWGGPRRGGRLAEPTRFGDWERKGRCTDF